MNQVYAYCTFMLKPYLGYVSPKCTLRYVIFFRVWVQLYDVGQSFQLKYSYLKGLLRTGPSLGQVYPKFQLQPRYMPNLQRPTKQVMYAKTVYKANVLLILCAKRKFKKYNRAPPPQPRYLMKFFIDHSTFNLAHSLVVSPFVP